MNSWQNTLISRSKELGEMYHSTGHFQYAMEDDTILHVVEITGSIYESIASFCKNNDIKRVVDIGSAYGHQSEIFKENKIDYFGINDFDCDFWNDTGTNYLIDRYPCHVPAQIGDLAISVLCLTWNCYLYEKDKTLHEQCQALANDFKHCLIYIAKDKVETMSAYFKKVEKVEDGLFYFSN